MATACDRAPLVFRPMREDDLDAVAAAEAKLFDFPWSRGNFADSLGSGYSTWVALADGRMAGYAVMMLVMDEAHLLNISVLPDSQHRGIGRRLLEFVIATARVHAAATLFLEVRPSNPRAMNLYEHYGFRRIGRRRDYYPAHFGREDAIVMSLAL